MEIGNSCYTTNKIHNKCKTTLTSIFEHDSEERLGLVEVQFHHRECRLEEGPAVLEQLGAVEHRLDGLLGHGLHEVGQGALASDFQGDLAECRGEVLCVRGGRTARTRKGKYKLMTRKKLIPMF